MKFKVGDKLITHDERLGLEATVIDVSTRVYELLFSDDSQGYHNSENVENDFIIKLDSN